MAKQLNDKEKGSILSLLGAKWVSRKFHERSKKHLKQCVTS